METKNKGLEQYPPIYKDVIIFFKENGEEKKCVGYWTGDDWLIEKYRNLYEIAGVEKEIIGWSYKNRSDKMEQVNHPAHYNSGKLECIDVMLDVFGAHDTIAFCKINAFKYLFRAGKKADNSEKQDLEKAAWYLNKAGELLTNSSDKR